MRREGDNRCRGGDRACRSQGNRDQRQQGEGSVGGERQSGQEHDREDEREPGQAGGAGERREEGAGANQAEDAGERALGKRRVGATGGWNRALVVELERDAFELRPQALDRRPVAGIGLEAGVDLRDKGMRKVGPEDA